MAKYFIRKEHLPSNKEAIYYVIKKYTQLGKTKYKVVASFMEKENAKIYKKVLIKKERSIKKATRAAYRSRAKILKKMKRNGEI